MLFGVEWWNMAKKRVSEELRRIYRDAYSDGIWLAEWKGIDGFWAAAGSLKVLRRAERKLGHKLDVRTLNLIQLKELGSVPASGKTREEACQKAVEEFKKFYRFRRNAR
jgi:predicted RNase H-like HicB family nuclease